jgi:hypothetical protein
MTTMELTPDELKLIEKSRAVEAERDGVGMVGDVILRDGNLTVTRYYGGRHPQFALYDGDTMICLCVYKKGALNAMDYILKLKGETR